MYWNAKVSRIVFVKGKIMGFDLYHENGCQFSRKISEKVISIG